MAEHVNVIDWAADTYSGTKSSTYNWLTISWRHYEPENVCNRMNASNCQMLSHLISDRSSGLQTSWCTLLLLGTPAGRRWHGWHHRHVRLGDYVLAFDIGQHFRHFFHHLWYTCPVTTASNSQRLCCIVSAFYQPITRIYFFQTTLLICPMHYTKTASAP